jgi:hypothetical protein
MKVSSLFIILILLVAVSSSGAQTVANPLPPSVRAMRGCYAMTAAEWSPPDVNAAYHRIPPLIRLDTVPSAVGGGWVLSPNIAYPYHGAFPGTPKWTFSADTLRLVWSNGFAPTLVTLVHQDSLWTGEAVGEIDAHTIPPSPLPRARVTARRVRCP